MSRELSLLPRRQFSCGNASFNCLVFLCGMAANIAYVSALENFTPNHPFHQPLICNTDSQSFSASPTMKTVVITLLVALTMQACLVPSMAVTAARAQTNRPLSTISYSLGAIVGVINVKIEAFPGWGRRRRRWKFSRQL